MLARIIEPTSKLDSLRVLTEAGMDPSSYRTVTRRLRVYAGAGQSPDGGDDSDAEQPAPADGAGGRWRARLARACAEHVRLGTATLLLYDVTTLYFETDEGDGFPELGYSNYADVVVMPRSPSGGWCSGWSAARVGVVGAA